MTSILQLSRHVMQAADALYKHNASAMGVRVTPTQYAIMLAISVAPGCTQQSLQDNSGIDRSTMSQVVRLLIKKRLISRRRTVKDLRAYAVVLTEAGKQEFALARSCVARTEEDLLGRLSPTARRQFFNAAHTLAERGGDHGDDAKRAA